MSASGGVGLTERSAHEFHSGGAPFFFQNRHGLRQPVEAHSFHLGVVVLERESRHFLFATPIEEMYVLGAEPHRGVGGIDRGIARADHDHGLAGFKIGLRLVAFDKAQRVDHAGELVAGDAEAFHGAETHADEDEIEVALQGFQRNRAAHFRLAELHAHPADQVHFAQAVGGAQFVLGHAVGIEAARERAIVEDGHRRAMAAQLGGTG